MVLRYVDKCGLVKESFVGIVHVKDTTSANLKSCIDKHHFQIDCFNEVLDWLLQELDSRFNETTSQLLVCSAAFNPRDSFHDFNVDSLLNLAKLYHDEGA